MIPTPIAVLQRIQDVLKNDGDVSTELADQFLASFSPTVQAQLMLEALQKAQNLGKEIPCPTIASAPTP